MKIDTIESLFTAEIKDLYDAEKQLVKALPKLAKAATSEELRGAIKEHLEVTKEHVRRLEEVFQLVDMKPKGKPCEAMKGLVAEGQEASELEGDGVLRDAAIIGAAKRVEHYEMAGYQSVILLAQAMGNEEASELLNQTLTEEESADDKLENLCQELLDGWKADPERGVESKDERTASRTRGKTRRAGE